MDNSILVISLISFTIWCYNHERQTLHDAFGNLGHMYRGYFPHLKTSSTPHHRPLPPLPHHGPPPPHLHHGPPAPPHYKGPPGAPPPLGHKYGFSPKVFMLFSILIIVSAITSLINISIGMIFIFVMTMIIIFLRPDGLNEAYPAAVGAIIVLITGVVSYGDLSDITVKVRGASITIISTIVMAVTLESFGFFHWVAAKLTALSNNSGYRLYWYIQLLCFLMTLLFNNDGSILITTPILILLLRNFHLPHGQQLPYLLSGALIATGSSTPIGVSNITNLIALNIIHMTLYKHTEMMFIPGTLGLLFMSVLMFMVLKKKLPRTLPKPEEELDEAFFQDGFHPTRGKLTLDTKQKRTSFMLKILVFVFAIRCLLFVASYFSMPIEIIAVLGSLILLIGRWYYLRTNVWDILRKTPWHILLFAFSMYVIIYGLHNIGLTETLVAFCKPIVSQGLFYASFIMGSLISLLSNIFNNHPALMIGTITLTNMGLDPITLKTIYLANIIGSDMGSLLLPIGTLASLMWMYTLKQNHIKVQWKEYIRVTSIVIPLTIIVTLFFLFFWIQIIFA